MKVGDKMIGVFHAQCAEYVKMGKVVYIHPQFRYYVLEYRVGKYGARMREAYQMMR